MPLGTTSVQDSVVGLEDRNRTAPFPFCGNRFEFRAVGSEQNVSSPVTFLGAAFCDGMAHLSELIEVSNSRPPLMHALLILFSSFAGGHECT